MLTQTKEFVKQKGVPMKHLLNHIGYKNALKGIAEGLPLIALLAAVYAVAMLGAG
jgi:lipopolysaccharide export LptBFGC system permease protein LptF